MESQHSTRCLQMPRCTNGALLVTENLVARFDLHAAARKYCEKWRCDQESLQLSVIRSPRCGRNRRTPARPYMGTVNWGEFAVLRAPTLISFSRVGNRWEPFVCLFSVCTVRFCTGAIVPELIHIHTTLIKWLDPATPAGPHSNCESICDVSG